MFLGFNILAVISIFIVTFQILRKIFQVLYSYVIGPLLKTQTNLTDHGKWAVITGSTDGIGKAFAEALASKGLNIILISRTTEKLETVSRELEQKYQVQTKIIEADFTNLETYAKIEKNIYGYEIGVLVNNVGLSYPHPEYFLDLPLCDVVYSSIINCNIYSVTNMCKIIMPQMIERKRGVIINVSSTAAKIPSPMLTVYGATKAYIEKFSADLATEYENAGIIIQCLLPGYVATKMSKIRKSSWMAPNPEEYVRNALKTVGIQKKTTGYYPHSMLLAVIYFIQYFSPRTAASLIIRVMETLRSRALRRQAT